MDYLQINDCCTVLVPLKIMNTLVYVCLNNKTNCYEFYEKVGSNFLPAKTEISEKLQKLFKQKRRPFLALAVSKKINPEKKKNLVPILEECIANITTFLKDYDPSIRKRVLSLFTKLEIITENEFQEDILGNLAVYVPSENKIVLNKTFENWDKFFMLTTLQHELVHCASRYTEFGVGFCPPCYENTDENGYIQMLSGNVGLTEILTEYITNLILSRNYCERKNEYMSSYDITLLSVTSLLNQLDEKQVVTDLLTSNREHFVEHISKTFHCENTAEIYRLISLIDMCVNLVVSINSEISNFDKMNKLLENIKIVTQCHVELLKTVFDLHLNKLIFENKSFKDIDIDYLFNLKDVKSDIFTDNIKKSLELKNYIKFMKSGCNFISSNKNLHFKYPQNEVTSLMIHMLQSIRLGLLLPENPKYEELKKFEIYSWLLNEKNFVYDTIEDQYFQFKQKELFSVLVDSHYNYLPQAKTDKLLLFEKFIKYRSNFNFDLIPMLPRRDVLILCNSNFNVLRIVASEHFEILKNNLGAIPSKNKVNLEIYSNMFMYVCKLPKEEAFSVIKNYYYSMEIEDRTNLIFQNLIVKSLNQLSYNEQSKEYNNFVSVMNKDCENTNTLKK